jgi:hypothetical protein
MARSRRLIHLTLEETENVALDEGAKITLQLLWRPGGYVNINVQCGVIITSKSRHSSAIRYFWVDSHPSNCI